MRTARGRRLSKSRYIAGLQCHLRLWNEVVHPELKPEVDAPTAMRFAVGHQVSELARRRYPGGVLIEADRHQLERAVEQTRSRIEQGTAPAIFEATFDHGGILVRVDVLERTESGGWNLVEVKSGTKPRKVVYLEDVAVQYWVLKELGVPVERASLLLLNRDYVYDGVKLDVDELLCPHDVTDDVHDLLLPLSHGFRDLRAGDSTVRRHAALRHGSGTVVDPRRATRW